MAHQGDGPEGDPLHLPPGALLPVGVVHPFEPEGAEVLEEGVAMRLRGGMSVSSAAA